MSLRFFEFNYEIFLDDCILQQVPRDNLLRKWTRMIDFNFRLDRSWKAVHIGEGKEMRKCHNMNAELPKGQCSIRIY